VSGAKRGKIFWDHSPLPVYFHNSVTYIVILIVLIIIIANDKRPAWKTKDSTIDLWRDQSPGYLFTYNRK